MPTVDLSGPVLHLERVLDHPVDRVFGAFVASEVLEQWWGPRGFTVPRAELDVRVGGRYRLTMQPPEGDVFHLGGEYREVDPPRRLVFTFEWEEPDPDDRETLVTLTFEPVEAATRMVFDQGVFATEERYELHRGGWTDTLDRLEAWLG
jgi:uncharacterized protein YndB with AHSA1/START domain